MAVSLLSVVGADDGAADAALVKDALRLGEKVLQQPLGGPEHIGPARIIHSAVPMVVFLRGAAEARTRWLHAVCIVEAYEPGSVRIMQCERISQPMRTLRRRRHPRNLEFEPMALFEVVDATIECQQKFKCVVVGNGEPFLVIMSGYYIILVWAFKGGGRHPIYGSANGRDIIGLCRGLKYEFFTAVKPACFHEL